MTDLTTRAEKAEKELIAKKQKRNLSTTSLSVTGDVDVRIQGRNPYLGRSGISVCYEEAMRVNLTGVMRETGDKIIEVKDGKMEITAYRKNRTEENLNRQEGKVSMRTYIDPEVEIYQGSRKTKLSQVQGPILVTIRKGEISYEKSS